MPGLKQQVNTDHGDAVDDDVDFDVDNNHDIPAELLATIGCPGHSCPITNHFAIAKLLQYREVGTVPVPLHLFSVRHTSFHLAYAPSIRNISVDDAALKFGLPDLQPAITDFLSREAAHGQDFVHTIGGLGELDLLLHFRSKSSNIIWPAQTLNCSPPSDIWTYGRYDPVIINNDVKCAWPINGLYGHTVGEIRLIMCPVGKAGTNWSQKDHFLTYVYRFDFIPQGRSDCELSTQLHILKRAMCSNDTRVGDIVPVMQLRAPVNLIPCFGASADHCLTPHNSMEHSSEFWLNKYWDKNTFLPLSMY
ncbi:uncharacterized protein F5891DRAFT_987430 [Suillus fuscotomentosus]|uniref:DUF6830 domain-containing protein n=1 Tax=Suillus fuscotomentosus TaxID=1912939 RepID=A0AAD4DQB8_9AGAM|nr:uncharacterized protein F5891DRAFT_987430 [Suillus fuscotomentosus]KAG1889113.1 hypothetical protein F5891DRAFT_987430 [Suillus fuscotomentosus]